MTAEEFIKQAHDYSKGKVCAKCKEHKLLSEFNKGIQYKDGLEYRCRSCKKEYSDNECPFKKWFMFVTLTTNLTLRVVVGLFNKFLCCLCCHLR